ncbi:hypothetical protein BGZ61DRAFT_455619 [Ilyonectria robusta]|uniref:uncharacterized protein n=1 Tax=Ilyonectria robusta TaxID=1079257 RepID=UPI001E8D91A8|nr:uncharacterized protein BGZ61DRAFT_455619 [Ilyonectria robusta]KAH8684088.1 hypothetical protein BGZ61DRAFT_455619 [Ilyonectria robusta]
MYLPPEIRSEIASRFLLLELDPWFYSDFGSAYNEFMRRPAKENPFNRFSLFRPNLQVWVLLKLRLVSRDWYQTATILLQEHFWWPLKFDFKSSLERAVSCCLPSGESSSTATPWALPKQFVTKLNITEMGDVLTFRRCYFYDNDLVQRVGDDAPYAECHTFKDEPLRRQDRTQMELHYDKSSEHELLRNLFNALETIEAFSISFPRAEFDKGYDYDEAMCYDMQAIHEMAVTFQHGLNSPAFQHLVDLRLDLPCTKDVELMTKGMSKDARDRLKHLRIWIMDETGRDGNDGAENTGDTEEEGVADGNSAWDGIPPSNLQAEFPNKRHQSAVWDFVGSCPNLESLSISGTHFLDLDQLNWIKSSGSRGLRLLSLHRIWTSISSIIELLRAHPKFDGPPQLRGITLCKVKVHANGGNWSSLFAYLKESCSDLNFSRMDQLTYFENHENFSFNNRIWENYNAIWTENEEDWDELRSLTRHLIRRAGGKEYYPEELSEMILEDDEED